MRNLFVIPLMISTVLAPLALAAPKPDLWPRWEAHDPSSQTRIDHGVWDRFLKEYVVVDHPSRVNRVGYADVSPADRQTLDRYLNALQDVEVSRLSRDEQKAYWINFYNALTVNVILDHLPVTSIRDIDISPGLFKDGPWDAKLATVEGEGITLNDMEHRILRPIWKDPRVHYAVNCASLGCPNLQPEAYTAANTERLLEKGAGEYVNHPRGARIEDGKLTVSSIYEWFRVDFGGSQNGVIEHLLRYAEGPLAEKLRGYSGKIRDEYDWSLNAP